MKNTEYLQYRNDQFLGGPKIEDCKIDLKDGPCPGQSKGAANEANIAAVEDMVNKDARFTVTEISKRGGL